MFATSFSGLFDASNWSRVILERATSVKDKPTFHLAYNNFLKSYLTSCIKDDWFNLSSKSYAELGMFVYIELVQKHRVVGIINDVSQGEGCCACLSTDKPLHEIENNGPYASGSYQFFKDIIIWSSQQTSYKIQPLKYERTDDIKLSHPGIKSIPIEEFLIQSRLQSVALEKSSPIKPVEPSQKITEISVQLPEKLAEARNVAEELQKLSGSIYEPYKRVMQKREELIDLLLQLQLHRENFFNGLIMTRINADSHVDDTIPMGKADEIYRHMYQSSLDDFLKYVESREKTIEKFKKDIEEKLQS